MFRRLLIANRGEIACRIARTARRLGIATVAVYLGSGRDRGSVDLADEAWSLGAAPARDSYLAIDKVIDVARRSHAEAVIRAMVFCPRESAFAQACAAAELIFVGPPASAMRSMGSKASAKTLMQRAGIAIVPGYHGEVMDLATLKAEAERIGFPVLVKASNGGGGARDAASARARRARGGHGRSDAGSALFLWRQSPTDRKISHAATTCRGADFRRRARKLRLFSGARLLDAATPPRLLEETPALGLSRSLRQEMREAAVAAAKAVGYIGAGTVRIPCTGRAFLLLGDEHPLAGRASDHRNDRGDKTSSNGSCA